MAQRPSDKNITSNEDITSINRIAPIKNMSIQIDSLIHIKLKEKKYG